MPSSWFGYDTACRSVVLTCGPRHAATDSRNTAMAADTAYDALEQQAADAAGASSSGLIERDPSVNKSLLLRLIAGVRGL